MQSQQLLPPGALTDQPLKVALKPVFELIPPEIHVLPPPGREVLLKRMRRFRRAATLLEGRLEKQRSSAKAPDISTWRALIRIYRQIANAIEGNMLPPMLNQADDPKQVELVFKAHYLADLRISSSTIRHLLEATQRDPVPDGWRQMLFPFLVETDGSFAELDEAAMLAMIELAHYAAARNLVPHKLVRDLRTRYDKVHLMWGMGVCDAKRFRLAQAVLNTLLTTEVGPVDKRIAQLSADAALHGVRFGYVPTPPAWIAMLAKHAHLCPGMRVLDVDAGTGGIADYVAEAAQVVVSVVEVQRECLAVLNKKNYLAYTDGPIDFETFNPAAMTKANGDPLDPGYNRILLDPPQKDDLPFRHIRHAFAILKRPGRMVAIIAGSYFERPDPAAAEFYAWYGKLKSKKCLPLPVDTESDRPRPASYLLVIDKG